MTITPVPQRDAAWLGTATAEQVAAALKAGELADLLGGRIAKRPAPGTQLTAEDLAGMTPDEIAAAFAQGSCDAVLGRSAP